LYDGTVCGSDALNICMAVTGLQCQLLVLGAILLMWSHLIWMVALIISFERHREARVVVLAVGNEGEQKGEGEGGE